MQHHDAPATPHRSPMQRVPIYNGRTRPAAQAPLHEQLKQTGFGLAQLTPSELAAVQMDNVFDMATDPGEYPMRHVVVM